MIWEQRQYRIVSVKGKIVVIEVCSRNRLGLPSCDHHAFFVCAVASKQLGAFESCSHDGRCTYDTFLFTAHRVHPVVPLTQHECWKQHNIVFQTTQVPSERLQHLLRGRLARFAPTISLHENGSLFDNRKGHSLWIHEVQIPGTAEHNKITQRPDVVVEYQRVADAVRAVKELSGERLMLSEYDDDSEDWKPPKKKARVNKKRTTCVVSLAQPLTEYLSVSDHWPKENWDIFVDSVRCVSVDHVHSSEAADEWSNKTRDALYTSCQNRNIMIYTDVLDIIMEFCSLLLPKDMMDEHNVWRGPDSSLGKFEVTFTHEKWIQHLREGQWYEHTY